MELQAKHSKSINLEISNEPQEYLTSDEINTDEKKLLFNLRSRMVDIKVNFKNKYNGNLRCTFCDKEEESAQHLLNCNEIINNPGISESVQANDIYKDLHHQSKAVKAWKTILNLRDDKIRKNESKK